MAFNDLGWRPLILKNDFKTFQLTDRIYSIKTYKMTKLNVIKINFMSTGDIYFNHECKKVMSFIEGLKWVNSINQRITKFVQMISLLCLFFKETDS